MMIAAAVVCCVFSLVLPLVLGSCPVQKNSDCVNQQQVTLPSTADLVDYCVSAPVAVLNAATCLNNCTSTSYTNFKQKVDNTCSVTPGCGNLTDMVASYYQCYDTWNGLNTIINAIVSGFNNHNTSTINTYCNELSWGRSCQRDYLTTCTYFAPIDTNYFLSNPLLDVVLYICGSEMVPLIMQTDTCSNSMASQVESMCGVACSLKNAIDIVGYCQTLQWQVNCILNTTAGCTSIQQQYLVPRLDSYAFANIALGCAIQILSVIIQPRDTTYCTYQSQLQQCFNINTPISTFNLLMVQQFFDVDQPINSYCTMLPSAAKYLVQCRDSMLFCTIPQAKTYQTSTTNDGSYAVSMGPFPINAWGLNTTFAWLNNNCPANTPILKNLCTLRATPIMRATPVTPLPRATPVLQQMTPVNTPNNGFI